MRPRLPAGARAAVAANQVVSLRNTVSLGWAYERRRAGNTGGRAAPTWQPAAAPKLQACLLCRPAGAQVCMRGVPVRSGWAPEHLQRGQMRSAGRDPGRGVAARCQRGCRLVDGSSGVDKLALYSLRTCSVCMEAQAALCTAQLRSARVGPSGDACQAPKRKCLLLPSSHQSHAPPLKNYAPHPNQALVRAQMTAHSVLYAGL